MELASKLFQEWIGEPDETYRITVLDIGPATPETVDFFAQYRCRLHFLDLLAEPWFYDSRDELTEEDWQRRFETLLAFPAGTRFDLCLFWDYLNYLDATAVGAFNAALLPYMTRDTRAHALGIMNAKTPLLQQGYGIKSVDEIKIRPHSSYQPPGFPHPQSELKKLLHGFDVRRGMLLANGQLEMLLRSTA